MVGDHFARRPLTCMVWLGVICSVCLIYSASAFAAWKVCHGTGRWMIFFLSLRFIIDCAHDNQLKSNVGVSAPSVWIFMPDFAHPCLMIFGDYPGKGFIVFIFIQDHGFRGRRDCKLYTYGWRFHAEDCKKTYTAKYLFVWEAAFILNTGALCIN